jgi:cytochrome c-type biogenesis protein CcmH
MMGLFLFAATGLILATLLLLLQPWRRPVSASGRSTEQVAATVFRDQLAELDRDLVAGTLAPADHAQARDDLKLRLLQEVGPEAAAAPQATATGRATLLIAIVLPLAATGLYGLLGAPEALWQPQPAAQAAMPPDVERMVAGLAARLERNPDDPKGWAMLARSYEVMGRHEQAQAAWARVGPQAP